MRAYLLEYGHFPNQTLAGLINAARHVGKVLTDLKVVVNGADLGLLLSGWGRPGLSDINGDGTTDGADLGVLLSHWG